MASFHSFGTVPVDKERLIMLVMVGASRSVHCLSRRVGMGSSAHVLEGADAIRSETVLIGTLSKRRELVSHIFSDRARLC